MFKKWNEKMFVQMSNITFTRVNTEKEYCVGSICKIQHLTS